VLGVTAAALIPTMILIAIERRERAMAEHPELHDDAAQLVEVG
jgi:hypothetical protein